MRVFGDESAIGTVPLVRPLVESFRFRLFNPRVTSVVCEESNPSGTQHSQDFGSGNLCVFRGNDNVDQVVGMRKLGARPVLGQQRSSFAVFRKEALCLFHQIEIDIEPM